MKVIFMGTPVFAVPILEGLIENYDVVMVVSQPDKEVGRHHILENTPIKKIAIKHGIPVFQPQSIKSDYQKIIDMKPDMIVTCAYGQIIPQVLLDTPKYGCINVHASLLPKLRGGAPIHKAIMYGHVKTGITIMDMVMKMDAGDIISTKETIIKDEDNLETLNNRLSIMGKDLLLETIPKILSNEVTRTKQNEDEVTYAWNVTHEEEHIDFSKEDTRTIFNHVRGLYPKPGAYAILDDSVVKILKCYKTDSFFTTRKNGEISRIYKDGFGVCTKDGEIVVTEFQLAGKKKMLVKDYFNGIDPDTLLGKVFK